MSNYTSSSGKRSSNNSFNDVDEELCSENSGNFYPYTPDDVAVFEELSDIPKMVDIEKLQIDNNELTAVLKSKLEILRRDLDFLSPGEIEEIAKIDNYIKKIDQGAKIVNKDLNDGLWEIDLEYFENMRKQQMIIKKILDHISRLQWAVESNYEKIKDTEVNIFTQERSNFKNYSFENIVLNDNSICSCSIC